MGSGRPVLCRKCYLQIASNDIRTVYNGTDYHQGCFLKLVFEEAEIQKARADVSSIKKEEAVKSRALGIG